MYVCTRCYLWSKTTGTVTIILFDAFFAQIIKAVIMFLLGIWHESNHYDSLAALTWKWMPIQGEKSDLIPKKSTRRIHHFFFTVFQTCSFRTAFGFWYIHNMLPTSDQESACSGVKKHAINDEALMLDSSENSKKKTTALFACLRYSGHYSFLSIAYTLLIFLYIRLYFESWPQNHATRAHEPDFFPC